MTDPKNPVSEADLLRNAVIEEDLRALTPLKSDTEWARGFRAAKRAAIDIVTAKGGKPDG